MPVPSFPDKLRDAYTYWRQRRYSPKDALANAHADVASGKTRYPRQTFGMAGGAPFKAYGERAMVWFEYPGDHMRLAVENAGNMDPRNRNSHDGWYLDDDCGDTVHGVVYQLPARDGVPQYLYGYADPWNDGACLSMDIADDKDDAARWADSIAERMAEQEREYRAASSARHRYDELASEIASERRYCLELIREAKQACASITEFPAIKAAIRSAIEGYRVDTRKARRERATLADGFGHHAAWNDA